MSASQTISGRRSIKKFTDRQISRDQIERLLEAVPHAPNHRMTQPWRFYVLGPESRRAYGAVLGGRKARKMEDAEAGRLVIEKIAREHESLPAMIAVAMVENANPEIREEDYAAVMMGVQNLALVAHEMGLGTHLKTGGVMEDPAAREAVGVADEERIIATVNLGEPAEVPAAKPREPASSHTSWRP
jgi:nitroreductase